MNRQSSKQTNHKRFAAFKVWCACLFWVCCCTLVSAQQTNVRNESLTTGKTTQSRVEKRLRRQRSTQPKTYLTPSVTTSANSSTDSTRLDRVNQRIQRQLQERRTTHQKPAPTQSPIRLTQFESPQQLELIEPAQNPTGDSAYLINKPWDYDDAATTNAQPIAVDQPAQPPAPSPANTVDAFEQIAIQNHPTLNAAVARILAARHEAVQAELAPNPQLGLFIEELGNENDPGLWGAYIQRNMIRGNKLALGREIKNREANVLEAEFETQVLRIKTDVRTTFYRLLIAQEKTELISQLFKSQQGGVAKSKQLFDAGETPKTDLLQTEFQFEKTRMLLEQSKVAQQNAWRTLTAVVGQPSRPPIRVIGSIEPMTEKVPYEDCLQQILINSPEILAAKAEMKRVCAEIQGEIAKTIPNYQTQLTLGRDSNSNHFFTGVQVQVPIQVNNRNQGNIAAAKSRLVVAENEVERVKLSISKRLSSEYQQYEAALVRSEMLAERLLPKAQQTLDLLVKGYPEEVSFVQLLTAQQTVIEITIEYLDLVNQTWNSRLKIEGLLLDGSLEK